jgi:hypothetical protein
MPQAWLKRTVLSFPFEVLNSVAASFKFSRQIVRLTTTQVSFFSDSVFAFCRVTVTYYKTGTESSHCQKRKMLAMFEFDLLAERVLFLVCYRIERLVKGVFFQQVDESFHS